MRTTSGHLAFSFVLFAHLVVLPAHAASVNPPRSPQNLSREFSTTTPALDRVAERANLLRLLDYAPSTAIAIKNFESAPADARLLFQFYQEFHAKSEEISHKGQRYAILHLALDRALYNDDEEKNAWMEEKNRLLNEINAWSSSEQYKQYVNKAYELTRFIRARPELSQYLAEWAEVLFETEKLTGTTTEDLPLLERMIELNSQIDEIANNSPINPGIGDTIKERDQIREKFYKGELTFLQATEKLKALVPRGYEAHGQYVAVNARAQLRELAILRTQLAKRKGFANWAQYQLATEKFSHNEGYATADERIQFLREYLENTQEQMLAYYRSKVAAQPGAVWGEINQVSASLLASPLGLRMKPYFDKNKVEEVVKQTLIESGFPASGVNAVNMDNYPRQGKHSHAYMYPAITPQPKILTFDASNMQLVLDVAESNWTKPSIFIVQNLRTNGMDAYEVAFHEMGHAMDYTYRRSQEIASPAYGYVETHSIFLERFMEDYDFLMAIGKNAQGQSLPNDLLIPYLQESAVARTIGFRQSMVFNSLYDLEVWNYAYDENTPDLVDRMLQLSRDMNHKYTPFREEVIGGVDQSYGMFMTDHFYSGSVRYIGYLYAEIAADMVYRSVMHKLLGRTGRVSLYRQPELGSMLIESFYKLGAMTKFPKVIEQATELPFSAQAQAIRFNQTVLTYLQSPRALNISQDSCARLLN